MHRGPRVLENHSLQDKHTFRLPVKARWFAELTQRDDLDDLLASDLFCRAKTFILGGGANLVFSGDYDGLVVRVATQGKRVLFEDEDQVQVEAEAGEDWPSFVQWTVEHGWGGVETLAGVPGRVGAAPVQHIACYGQNLSEALVSVNTVRLADGSARCFSREECRLGYRTSAFREELRREFLVLSVRLALRKHPVPNTSYYSRYESVESELATFARPPYAVKDVSEAVLRIRARKLPDLDKVGCAGSFFKNPVVSMEEFQELRRECPGLQSYPADQLRYTAEEEKPAERVRIPAGWLVDRLGLGGRRVGDCGVWPRQALNIVNYGKATPAELLEFAEGIRSAVRSAYGVLLENEVEVV